MISFKSARALLLCAVALTPVLATGCAEADATAIVGPSPTSPTSSTKASMFGLSADRLEFTLGSGCEADVNVFAEIQPREAEQRAIFEKPSNTEDRDFAVTGPLSARIHIRGPGTYRIWSMPADNPSLRKYIDIIAKGSCSGPTGPPSAQEPSVDLKSNGSDGPINNVPVNSDLPIDITLERCSAGGVWTHGPLAGQIIGGSGRHVFRITANTLFGASCTGPGGTDSDTLQVNVSPTTPPPVTQLTVTPGSLNLYPSSCPSAGQTSGTFTANMAVTWSSNNTHVASVASNGVVTGMSSGFATITARSADGQRVDVQVTINNCPQTPPQAPECSISVNPTSILSGQSATVVWSSSGGTTSVTSSWSSGSVSLSGSMSVNPTSTTTYSINCSNSAGVTVTRSATLTVTTTTDACAGANATLPPLDTKGQNKPFVINAGGSCRWALRSNNTHVVSATPFEGTGPTPMDARLWALNAGTATITLVLNQGASNERLIAAGTYIIK